MMRVEVDTNAATTTAAAAASPTTNTLILLINIWETNVQFEPHAELTFSLSNVLFFLRVRYVFIRAANIGT